MVALVKDKTHSRYILVSIIKQFHLSCGWGKERNSDLMSLLYREKSVPLFPQFLGKRGEGGRVLNRDRFCFLGGVMGGERKGA